MSLLQILTPARKCLTPDCINQERGRITSFSQDVINSSSALSVDDQVRNPLNLDEPRTHNSAVDGDDYTRAGIKIRPRQTDNQAARKIVLQGFASKRIRLQNKLKVRSVSRRLPKALGFVDEKCDARASYVEV